MAKKKQEMVVNKMYVWDIEVDGKDYEWKCFVGIDECITYGNGRELERMKIENMTQKQGVLQIDREVQVGDERVPFQLENGVPYIKLLEDDGERRWIKSDTTIQDAITIRSRQVKKEAYTMAVVGIAILLYCLVEYFVQGQLSEWNFFPMIAAIMLIAAAMNLVRLRNELMAMGQPFTWKL